MFFLAQLYASAELSDWAVGASVSAPTTTTTAASVSNITYVEGPTKVVNEALAVGLYQNLWIECGRGCSKQSVAYLGISCDTSVFDGIHAGSASSTPASQLLGDVFIWEVALSIATVVPGRFYRLLRRPGWGEPRAWFL
jgi:hypothetical protein